MWCVLDKIYIKSTKINIICDLVKGLCKVKKIQKSEMTMEVGGWVHVSLGKKIGKWSQNCCILVLIFGVVYHVYCDTLLKVVGHYDLSVLSMSVKGCQHKFG